MNEMKQYFIMKWTLLLNNVCSISWHSMVKDRPYDYTDFTHKTASTPTPLPYSESLRVCLWVFYKRGTELNALVTECTNSFKEERQEYNYKNLKDF